MPTYFQRPENALKRANEFIDVGKHPRALDALYDVIKSKKHRTWQKIHEPIMEKYLELCVELKKSHVAKEGLYQYKNICQQVNIKSLEDVVRKYLNLAEQKTETARLESHQAVIDIDDLDVIQSPESLLLKAVSGEDTQDRTDRAILTPWVKFLWESYRQCLDLLRNNSSVEKLYQDIAQQAFKFCLKYARKTEFRKLCDNLRTHLGHIHKHQHQQRAINLNNPESQAMHLETRLVQLDSAIQMELWQEAFKAVEDIHDLIALSKKPPKPSLMANYYQKLGLVFQKAGNHLFHACAWHRLFHLSRDQRKNLSQEELHRMASRVLCATLAIPIPAARNQFDNFLDMDDMAADKQRRLGALLGLSSPPTRQSLVKDLIKYNVIQYVYPELQNLYCWLEVEFHPLKLSSRLKSSIEFLETKDLLACYVPALRDISITRLLKQVSQVYQTIEFSHLATLAPFASYFHLERVVVDAAKNLDLQVRIDHRSQSLSFGSDLAVSQKEDIPEGPYLQSMPSENIRNQLTHMSCAVEQAIALIQPTRVQQPEEVDLHSHIISNYRNTARKEHQRILQRRQIIEERKEELENLNTQREREEIELRESEKRKQYEAEMQRLEREAAEREKQRHQEEKEKIKRAHAKERLEQLRQTSLGAKVFAEMDEEYLAELDADEIMAKQVEQLEKEKKELQDRLKGQEKKIDYFARAKRIEEIPQLQKQFEEERVKMREFWEQQEKERVEILKQEREVALESRDRLALMMVDKEEFINKLKSSRMSVYKDKLNDFESRISAERKKRLAERKEKRKEERRQKWLEEKEETEQLKRDEEIKRQREEAERFEAEKRQKEEEEYQDKVRKLEEQAEKQKQREREVEERQKKKEEQLREKEREDHGRDRDERPSDWRRGGGSSERSDTAPASSGAWRGGGGSSERSDPAPASAWRPKAKEGGGWRERAKAREDSWRPRDGDKDRDDRPGGRDDNRDGRDDRSDDRGGWRDKDQGDRDRDGLRGDRDRDGLRGDSNRDGPRDRDGPRGGAWRRDDDRDREPARGGWRGRDGDRDDRGGDSWRDRAAPSDRDRDRGGDSWRDRDSDRRDPPPRDDRDDWRRGPPAERDVGRRDDRRDFGSRDDRDFGGRDRAPPAREERGSSWRDRERDRDREGGGSSWRSARDDRGPQDDRGPREERDTWRSRTGDDRESSREDTWKRGGDSRGSPSKSERVSDRREDQESEPAARPKAEESAEPDGWTTVRR